MMLTCVILDPHSHADGEISIGFLVYYVIAIYQGCMPAFSEPQSPQSKA